MVDFSAVTVPAIVGICVIVGYCIKRIDNDRLHDFIPTIVCILGVILAIANAYTAGSIVTIDVIFAGMASGLASTGCYEMVTHWIESADE